MTAEAAIPTLVLIAVVAVVAPVAAELTRGRIPSVVIELLFGILIGPYVLNLANTNSLVTALSDIGLTFLMFLAGFELDTSKIKGSPLRMGAIGWLLSCLLALGFAFALVSSGLALDTIVVGMALTTTALGTLLPILSDAGVLSSRFGGYMVGVGTVGEFGPVVLIAVLLAHRDPLATLLLLLAFVVVAVATALLAGRSQPPKLVAMLKKGLNTSTQLPVRVSVLFVLLLVYLAYELGLDVLLGAFAAGIVVRLFTAGEDSEAVASKLNAIGFGFLIPIFFVVSGVHFDLHILVHHPTAWLRLLLFLVLMLVVRGLPALLLYRKELPAAERLPLALLSATGLPLIVVITTIGTTEGRMLPENAAALVGAGLVSVLLFPMIGLRMLKRPPSPRRTGSSQPAVEE